jgi:hypothetical protein
MKTNTTTTTTTKDYYTDAERAVYIALKARHEKSGLHFLAELQNAQATDKTARNNTQLIVNEITPLEQQLEHLIKEREQLNKNIKYTLSQIHKLTTTADDRREWQTLYKQQVIKAQTLKNTIKHTRAEIDNLSDILSTTYTDRADLTQTAVLKMLELEKTPAPITKTILNRYGVDTAEELTDTERADAQEQANFRAVINAVGRAINNLASPDAMNRTVSKPVKLTDYIAQQHNITSISNFKANTEQWNDNGTYSASYSAVMFIDELLEEEEKRFINQWSKAYGSMGKDTKVSRAIKRCRQSDCYDTLEYRDTKTQKGYYLVRHYKTIAPYQYIEDFNTTEDGENDIQYIKTYNPFISNSTDLDRIEELYKTADLTDRQKDFLKFFCRACRHSADFKECKNYAFSKIGVKTESNKTTFFNRLKQRLLQATK